MSFKLKIPSFLLRKEDRPKITSQLHSEKHDSVEYENTHGDEELETSPHLPLQKGKDGTEFLPSLPTAKKGKSMITIQSKADSGEEVTTSCPAFFIDDRLIIKESECETHIAPLENKIANDGNAPLPPHKSSKKSTASPKMPPKSNKITPVIMSYSKNTDGNQESVPINAPSTLIVRNNPPLPKKNPPSKDLALSNTTQKSSASPSIPSSPNQDASITELKKEEEKEEEEEEEEKEEESEEDLPEDSDSEEENEKDN
jgi:hypothetical protein